MGTHAIKIRLCTYNTKALLWRHYFAAVVSIARTLGCVRNDVKRTRLCYWIAQPAESWWNMPFKGTSLWRCGVHYCCYADTIVQHLDVTRFEHVLWRNTMHEWVMNIHYQTWIAQGRIINMSQTPSKQWGLCDKCFIWISIPFTLHGSTSAY